uniref:Centrosomal protein 95 n=1 Tax=Leptobrachium leishanense TaxID=445787 RepID=A0A8C5R8P9_9ANUR
MPWRPGNMGTREAAVVTIANNLLNKCHVEVQVRDVAECDARVFMTLYKAILGEKVPDYIPDSRNPEDEAHNVQSVIDSLALDYLQVSLSHITGENVVRGDAESIRNLLEIFDGLLEYLTEQISEASSQNGDDPEICLHQWAPQDATLKGRNGTRRPPSSGLSAQSSQVSVPSWDVDGSESTAELIRLGETAHTFNVRGPGLERLRVSTNDDKPASRKKSDGPDRSMLPLRGHASQQEPCVVNGKHPGIVANQEEPPARAIPLNPPYQPAPVCVNGHHPHLTSPKRSREPPREDIAAEEQKEPETTGPAQTSQKKVAFRTLPEIRFMTQGTQGDDEEEERVTSGLERLRLPDTSDNDPSDASCRASQSSIQAPASFTEEPLSVQRVRNKVSEQELKDMSEKLARRLDTLDQMLKKALGEHGLGSDAKDEDKLSQHSDSIMEYRRKKQLQATRRSKKLPSRPRSLSSSPVPRVPPQPSLSAQFEDELHKEGKGEMGRIRRDVQRELDQQRLKSQMLNQAYEDEFRDLEEREKAKLSELKARLKETDQECDELPKRSEPDRIYSKKPTSRKAGQWHPPVVKPPAQLKIKENELLPVLLQRFPQLPVSPHTLNTLWKGQAAQIDQLSKAAAEDERSERKLQLEVEEAHKKHEMLVDLIKKEQEHKQRLKDFKDRISLQKSAQNKTRENRQQVVRAKRYYDEYHVQLRAKMMRARTREERIVKKLFADGLELQKQRLREMRSYAKELREEQRKRHKDELESMENYYKDQTLHKMKRELRAKMERDIQALQDMIIRADEDAFFRELEAERLKKRLQMASFQHSKSHGL